MLRSAHRKIGRFDPLLGRSSAIITAAQGVKNSSADPNTISRTFRYGSNAELDMSRL